MEQMTWLILQVQVLAEFPRTLFNDTAQSWTASNLE